MLNRRHFDRRNQSIVGSISPKLSPKTGPTKLPIQSQSRSPLAVKYLPIGTLVPNPKNTRTHSKHQIRKIGKSIDEFGFLSPILIDLDRNIVAGHGRVLGATSIGMTELPTICIEDLTPEQIRAYAIADNRIALDAGFDQELLKLEFSYLSALPDFDVSLTGFEIAEIDLILGEPEVEHDPADQVPALPSIPLTKQGDLWLLGDHRIYCGDARNSESFSTLMDGRRASAVFIDPPYNVPIDGHVSGNGQVRHREFAMATGEMSESEFTDFLATVLLHLAKWSNGGSIHYVAMDFRHMSELLAAGGRAYETMLNLCVWCKDNGGLGSFYRSQHELIFVFKSGKGPTRNNVQLGRFGRNRTNVWRYPGANTLSRSGDEGNVLAMHLR